MQRYGSWINRTCSTSSRPPIRSVHSRYWPSFIRSFGGWPKETRNGTTQKTWIMIIIFFLCKYIISISFFQIYFFTIEFGLCRSHSSEQLYENDRIRKNGELKVYGAGLLSSANELQVCWFFQIFFSSGEGYANTQLSVLIFLCVKHAISNDANVEEFQLEKVINQSCLVTTYQENYFYTRTFEEVIQKLRWIFWIGNNHNLNRNLVLLSNERAVLIRKPLNTKETVAFL